MANGCIDEECSDLIPMTVPEGRPQIYDQDIWKEKKDLTPLSATSRLSYQPIYTHTIALSVLVNHNNSLELSHFYEQFALVYNLLKENSKSDMSIDSDFMRNISKKRWIRQTSSTHVVFDQTSNLI